MPTLTLRAATQDDLDLAYEITRDAMHDPVVATWGRWGEAEEQAKHRARFRPDIHRIVLVEQAAAGIVAVEQEPGCLWLVKLYLKHHVRNRGVGTALLRQVIVEADTIGKPVRLRVLRVNVGAQRFYARHGFRVVAEEPERLFMLRPPTAT